MAVFFKEAYQPLTAGCEDGDVTLWNEEIRFGEGLPFTILVYLGHIVLEHADAGAIFVETIWIDQMLGIALELSYGIILGSLDVVDTQRFQLVDESINLYIAVGGGKYRADELLG